MSRDGWHIRREAGALTLSRRGPPRLEFWAESRFPRLRAAVLAHELRKDLWRALRTLRGFAPVIRIVEEDAGLTARAGGAILSGGRPPAGTVDRIALLLSDPVRRARWIAHAKLRS